MKIHEHYIDFFEQNPVHTESMAYALLKKEPLQDPVNYLAVSWYGLLKNHKLHLVEDLRLDGGFTICQHIHYYELLPLLKRIGIHTLFASHADLDDPEIKILPFPHVAPNGVSPGIKNIWYSFIGYDSTTPSYTNYPLRRKIFDFPHPESALVIERNAWHFDRDVYHASDVSRKQQDRESSEYRDILARSRFSLCPRGTGVNSLRIWESLQAGAIPVVFGDGMRLPAGVNWDECLLWLPEEEVSSLLPMLQAISPERENVLRGNGLKAYEALNDKNLVQPIREWCRLEKNKKSDNPNYWTYSPREKKTIHITGHSTHSKTLPTRSRTTSANLSLIEELKKTLRLTQKRNILEVSCGNGTNCEMFRLNGTKDITGVDQPGRLNPLYCHQNIRYLENSLEKLPFRDGEFRMVVLFSLLDLNVDPLKVVLEMCRVTQRPGGVSVVRAGPFSHSVSNHCLQELGQSVPSNAFNSLFLGGIEPKDAGQDLISPLDEKRNVALLKSIIEKASPLCKSFEFSILETQDVDREDGRFQSGLPGENFNIPKSFWIYLKFWQ